MRIQKSLVKTHYAPLRARSRTSRDELLMIEVTFGSAQQNCAGSGICKAIHLKALDRNLLQKMNRCSQAISIVKIDQTNAIVFFFVMASMCKHAIKQYFSENIFRVESAFELAISAPKMERKFTIPSGEYPAEFLQDYIIVKFKDGS